MQQNGESNDLLDKRDQLELNLSNYVDINVTRSSGSYELKIAGQSVISNYTNLRNINLTEENSSQKDKFVLVNSSVNPNITYDALKYNSDFSAKTIDSNDVFTYKLNNELEVSVKIDEVLTGDWDNNPSTADTTQTVDKNNLVRALALKINSNSNMKDLVTAYNGDYSIDSNGNKTTVDTQDNYLRIESKFEGNQNQFDGRVTFEKYSSAATPVFENRESIYRNDTESKNGESKVYLSIYDSEISLKSGSLKAQIDNLSSDSSNNKYQVYLDKLDKFAQTLSDITNKYVQTGTNSYVYGAAASDENSGSIVSLGLFTGSSVKNLKFNENSVNDLSQEKLDYLATIQWKEDLSFNGKAQNTSSEQKGSLLGFFRDIKVNVSSDKENINFLDTTQKNVKMSIESSYDQLTKVDKDSEMLDLMKFQAAYTANAKIVTAIDEMLQTLLGIKR